jgi:hypothetical protein
MHGSLEGPHILRQHEPPWLTRGWSTPSVLIEGNTVTNVAHGRSVGASWPWRPVRQARALRQASMLTALRPTPAVHGVCFSGRGRSLVLVAVPLLRGKNSSRLESRGPRPARNSRTYSNSQATRWRVEMLSRSDNYLAKDKLPAFRRGAFRRGACRLQLTTARHCHRAGASSRRAQAPRSLAARRARRTGPSTAGRGRCACARDTMLAAQHLVALEKLGVGGAVLCQGAGIAARSSPHGREEPRSRPTFAAAGGEAPGQRSRLACASRRV